MISLSKTSCVRRLRFPPVEQSGAHSGSCKLVCGCRGKWIFLTQMLSCHHLCLATREADVLFLDLRLVVTDLGVTYVSQNCICPRGATVFIELYAILGGGHGNPFQYFCLEDPMDKGAWWATIHRVAKSWTCLSTWHTQVALIFEILWCGNVLADYFGRQTQFRSRQIGSSFLNSSYSTHPGSNVRFLLDTS